MVIYYINCYINYEGIDSFMKFLIQKVSKAQVSIDNKLYSKIDKGLVVFIGITHTDTKNIADYMINKLINLRIFKDKNDKLNLSLKDVAGQLLLVSQFTLYADCSRGNRPSFIDAAKSDYANMIYQYIVDELSKKCEVVKTGIFGAHMQVSLINDGPTTIILEK